MGVGVGADAVAGEQRLAAEQGVAGPFVIRPFGETLDMVAALREPRLERRRWPLAQFSAGDLRCAADPFGFQSRMVTGSG